jgi:hypothetical protein
MKDFKTLLNGYFHDSIKEINRQKHYLHNKKTLDYFEFKALLDLTVEFFEGIDATFTNETVAQEFEALQALQNAYARIGQIPTEASKELFKELFLTHDARNRELIVQSQEYAQKYKRGKIKLQNIKAAQAAEKRKAILSKLSVIKKAYQNSKALVLHYQKSTYIGFNEQFESMRSQLKKRLRFILDARSYELNKMLWERANAMPKIQAYFTKNGIEGHIDAKVFLKHYLQVTDMPTEFQSYKDLVKLFQLLKNQKRKSVVIAHDDIYELEQMKRSLQNYDKDLVVQGYVDYKQLLKESKPQADLIILDYAIRGLRYDLEAIKTSYNDSEFLLLFERDAKEDIVHAHSFGLFNPKRKNCLLKPKHLKTLGLTQKVYQLL